MSKGSWYKQFHSDLSSAYRLIAFDLPCHGDSESPIHSNDYSVKRMAEIIASAVNLLADGKPYIIAGFSLGTNVLAEMLAYNIKPVGLVLASPSIVSDEIPIASFLKPNTHIGVLYQENPEENDVMLYARESSLSEEEEDINVVLEDYKKTAKTFRHFLAASIAEKNYSDEIELIQKQNVPALIVFGKEEQHLETAYLDNVELPLWRNEIFKIPGASHPVNYGSAPSI